MSDDLTEPEYDIQLRHETPGPLGAVLPRSRTCRTPTQTALVGQVREPAQLAHLLERVQSAGLVLDGIHRLGQHPTAAGENVATYEVRVDGVLGAPLLHYLIWRHHVIPERTLIRVAAGSVELLNCLRAFTDSGASIEYVRRIFPAPDAECA